MDSKALDYSEYIEIADGVYWVGFADERAGLHCNPYLIADGDEAVLIDGGSRDDFSTVMLKIIRAGVSPNKIKRLIYQHYDPDLCGSIPHMEAVINHQDLKIISHHENNIFIKYYSVKSPMQCIEELKLQFAFSSGRLLKFIRTPFAHCPGSFMTYDTKTKVLFSSDLFGSYDFDWSLYTQVEESCGTCIPEEICPVTKKRCQIFGILAFHKRIMTSKNALDYAMAQTEKLNVSLIAPQHGSILNTRVSQEVVIGRLKSLENVGFDYFMEENK